ncbi:MAG: hypothetical protein ACR2NP_07225 [Pirellulaceae bacterium]
MSRKEIFRRSCSLLAIAMMMVGFGNLTLAQTGTLAEPASPPSPNAGLHYQRALLYLQAIDKDQTGPIQQPIWETVPRVSYQEMSDPIKRVLYQGRLALRSAASGTRLNLCDFGIDFSGHGAGTPLPHVRPMVRLGRLLTLRGVYEMTRGNWEEAAVIFFDGLRMGRHMNQQRTVAEALAGMEILENNYVALGYWAANCPNPKTVIRAQRMLETIAGDLVDPTRTVAGELGILSQRLVALDAAFPDGPWAELVLEELGKDFAEQSLEELRVSAVNAAVDAGVERPVFENPESFRQHVQRISAINKRFTEAAAACMTLPPKARVERGQQIFDTYNERVGALGASLAFNPAEFGKTFAIHEAELTLARLALAIGATRTETGFPQSLSEVGGIFGGATPVSPYDSSPIEYTRLDDGAGYSITVPEMRAETALFPEVNFSSIAPAGVDE